MENPNETKLNKKENEIVNKIDELIATLQPKDPEILHNMICELTKIASDQTEQSDLKIIEASLSELRKSFKLFGRYRDYRKVCIFGSARTHPTHPNYFVAEELAQKISQKGFMIITGAGGGIMEAGNKGSEPNQSFGVNIDLPFEQSANPYIANSPKLINYKYFFNRKLMFIKESDATILFPGGFGTHDEGFEILTLIQTGKSAPRPIILCSQPYSEYWERWNHFVETELLDKGYISDEDLSLFTIIKDVDQAVDYVEKFYSVYHSVRYFGNTTYIRLNKSLSEQQLDTINSQFSQILTEGKFVQQSYEESELDKELYPDKQRLVFSFNRSNYGRLTQLIHKLNTFA